MRNMYKLREQSKKQKKKVIATRASNLLCNWKMKVTPKRPKKATKPKKNDSEFLNEMHPKDQQQYYDPQRCEAVGSNIEDALHNAFYGRNAEYECPQLQYQRKHIVIDCERYNQCLIDFQHQHRNTTDCDNPIIYTDYIWREGKDWGYDIVGACMNCNYISYQIPINNYTKFDDDVPYNSFYLSLIEAGNSIGLGFRQLKILCALIDIPFPLKNVYQKYDERLINVVQYQTNNIIKIAIQNERRISKSNKISSALDASFSNKRYQRSSRNAFLFNISRQTHQIIDVQTRSRDYNFIGASLNMEPDMIKSSLFESYNKGLIPHEIGVDFDTATNNIRLQTIEELQLQENIAAAYDSSHWLKNSAPRLVKLLKKKLDVDSLELENKEQLDSLLHLITRTWADALLSSILSYTVKNKDLRNVDDAYDHMNDGAIAHYCPKDELHSQCLYNGNLWCPVICNKTKGNKSSKVGRPLPTNPNLPSIVFEVIYKDILPERVLQGMMLGGSTSWNEAANNVAQRLCGKMRYLQAMKYRSQVNRAGIYFFALYTK